MSAADEDPLLPNDKMTEAATVALGPLPQQDYHYQLVTTERSAVDVSGLAPRNESFSLSGSERTLSIDDAIERLGMGRFQYTILFASGLCFAADAIQVVLLSFLSLVLQREWGLTNNETALLTSMLFAGAMAGTLCLGPLADRIGRRAVFLLAASVICGFGLLMALGTRLSHVLAAIFGVGFGVGGLTIPFDILCEVLPAARRGRHLLQIEYFWTLGCLYVVAVAHATLPGAAPRWRLFLVLGNLPCLVAVAVGHALVPESARWLAARGRPEAAVRALRSAAAANGLDAGRAFPEGLRLRPEPSHGHEGGLTDLFRPKWRRTTLLLWGAWCGYAFGYYGAILLSTKVFQVNDASTDSETRSFDYSAIFVSSSAELLGTTLVINTIDRFGRIPSQVVSYLLAGAFICLLGILSETRLPHATLVAMGFLTRVFEMSATCATWVGTAEVLTTDIRTTGHSAANAVARLGAFAAPFVVVDSRRRNIGVIMLVVHLFTAACVSRLPETRGKAMGLSLTSNDVPIGERDGIMIAEEESDRISEVTILDRPGIS